jgi:hypothetical protein
MIDHLMGPETEFGWIRVCRVSPSVDPSLAGTCARNEEDEELVTGILAVG